MAKLFEEHDSVNKQPTALLKKLPLFVGRLRSVDLGGFIVGRS